MKTGSRCLLIVALILTQSVLAQDVLECDFTGTDPASNLPWTATSFLAPGVSFSGWTLGPGAQAAAGVDDALAFSVSAGPQDSDLASAVQDGEHLTCTLTPISGALNLGGCEISVTARRLSWWAPRTHSLFISSDGFTAGQELFSSTPVGNGDMEDVTTTFVVPLSGYDGLTGPVELRLVAHAARYGGHVTSLRGFSILDPGPVHPLSLLPGPGGTITSNPPGGLVPAGTTVVVTAAADAGFALAGWSGALSGVGGTRTLVVTGPTTVGASFVTTSLPEMKLGTNLPGVVDWATAWIFVDEMKMAREWLTRSVNGSEWDSGFRHEIPTDGSGWPTAIPFLASDGAQHFVHTIVPLHDSGTYTFQVDGTGTVRINHPTAGAVLTLNGGTTTVPLAIPAGNTSNLLVEIRSSSAADPVRAIRVIHPGFTATPPTFHPLFLSRLGRFSTLRFMDMARTNGQQLVSWSDRTPSDNYTQSAAAGAALEVMIELTNELGVDPWFCVPHLADDNWVVQCARLLRDNVDPNLKIRVEYSNETWNSIFPQSAHVNARGLALGLSTSSFEAGQLYTARRSAEIWSLFEQEFLDDSRLVKVLAGHSANPSTMATRLTGLLDPVVNPTGVLADSLSIAPYFGVIYRPQDIPPAAPNYPEVNGLFDQVIPSELAAVRSHVRSHRVMADANGMTLTCYEAGQHFVGTAGAENDNNLTAILTTANRDPRMRPAYIEYLDILRAEGVDSTCHFSYCGGWSKWGSWGALEYQDQPLGQAPKHDALEAWRPLVLSTVSSQLAAHAPFRIGLTLDGGPGHAARDYLIVAGASGTFPGSNLPSGDVLPLVADELTDLVFAASSTTLAAGFVGTLDSSGGATATLDLPLTVPAALIGVRLDFAALLLNPFVGISNATRVDIVP